MVKLRFLKVADMLSIKSAKYRLTASFPALLRLSQLVQKN